MLRPVGVAFAALLATMVALVACGDLFHDTSEIRNACELDANAEGCTTPTTDGGPNVDGGTDAGDDASGPINFCEWDSATARANALRACTWLGACMPPIGANDLGECVFNALLAYDCTAAPQMRLREGVVKNYWECMHRAASCGDVERCVFPGAAQLCAPGPRQYTTCGTGQNAPVRVQCEADAGGSKTVGEACFATGRWCRRSADQSSASCAGNTGLDCREDTCVGATLVFCAKGVGDAGAGSAPDIGRDCTDIGAGRCAVVGGVPGCVPLGPTTCVAARPACVGQVAKACIAGVEDTADCTKLIGPNACSATRVPENTVRSASDLCGAAVANCTPGCSGSRLVSCFRGATTSVDCRQLGFSGCGTVGTVEGQKARCLPP